MKKWLIGIAVALVAAYLVLDFGLGAAVKAGINRFGPSLTQTKVQLEGAHFSPLTGSGTLSGLTVGNPPGWSSDMAFYLGKVHVKVEPASVLGDHIVIDEVAIDGPEFVYETRFVSSNIGDLMKNIERSSASGSARQAKASDGKPLRFEIKHFQVTNGRVTLGVGPTAVTLPMPPITLDNLGANGGITSDQVAVAVMRSVAAGVVQSTTQAVTKVGGTMGAAAGNALGNAANGLKSLFGGSH